MELMVRPVARLGTLAADGATPRTALHVGMLAMLALGGACGSELSGPHFASDSAVAEVTDVTEVAEVAKSDEEASEDAPDETAIATEVGPEVAAETIAEVEAEVAPDTSLDTTPLDTTPGDTGPRDAAPETVADPCAGLADGTPCDDHNACTLGDRCLAGACRPATPLTCDDQNPCTDDTCLAASGCVHLPNFAGCDDGDVCTKNDRCLGGLCTSGVPLCVDDNPCTRDLCDPTHPAHPCSFVDDDGAPCEDASACTGGDVCAGGVCLSGLADGCASPSVCIASSCAADGLHCQTTPLSGTPCDDGNACTSDDHCEAGYCASGAAVDCGWNTYCARFHCDAVQGCLLDETYAAGKYCDDNDECTTGDVCDETGHCVTSGVLDCDDHSACTTDSCDPYWGCRHTTLYGGPCDDGDACTSSDSCSYYGCGGITRSCDDHDACTRDSCDPLLGCQAVRISCDDGNDCTVDSCDAKTGCTHTPRTSGACDDQRGCTTGDHCEAGVCVGTSSCDDGNPCTSDWCDAQSGCGATRLCGLGDGCDPSLVCVEPKGALQIASVVHDVDGTIVGVRNISAATFDLAGFGLGSTSCGCNLRVREHVLIAPGETLTGRAARDATGDEDFVFGLASDVFGVVFAGDEVRLEGPLGAIPGGTVATFTVGAP